MVFGNQNGTVEALDKESGKKLWSFQTGGPLFSSPAVSSSQIVFGSADGTVYCLDGNGKLSWKQTTAAAVLGSPLIHKGTVYIGGSDHHFRGFDLTNGQVVLDTELQQGPVTSQPVVADSLLIFGAWDTWLYAYDLAKKELRWKWNNGSKVINFSPAACIPVVKDGVVYVVAPDRYLSAIELASGQTLWRTNAATVRESIGIAENGSMVYGKTMQDTLVAYYTGREKPVQAWKMHVGYGYEHAPSMLIEKGGLLFFGTKNGTVYAIDPVGRSIRWAHKVDHSMVNTVQVLSSHEMVVSTMDGKVCLLQF